MAYVCMCVGFFPFLNTACQVYKKGAKTGGLFVLAKMTLALGEWRQACVNPTSPIWPHTNGSMICVWVVEVHMHSPTVVLAGGVNRPRGVKDSDSEALGGGLYRLFRAAVHHTCPLG